MVRESAAVTDVATVGANLREVRQRIAQAAERAGRAPDGIRLVGVSKTFPAESVIAAVDAGLIDVGENWVQEAAAKVAAVSASGRQPVWHLVGHLQTNKVKTALDLFGLIHSIDSIRLAEALSRHAQREVTILLEVNVAGEATKTGFNPDQVAEAARAINALPKIRLAGLMTVAPLVEDPEVVRPVFRRLRELTDSLGLDELSMGMSADYEVAIAEGATMVRIGRAIFGERG